MRMAWPLALLLACGSERTFSDIHPEIAVLPETLDFGDVVEDVETRSLELYVENLGPVVLIADVEIVGDDPDAFTLGGEAHLELEPEGSLTLPVVFAPTELRPYSANVLFTSNDTDDQNFVVPLTGVGRVPYAPEIEVDPLTLVVDGEVGEDKLGFVDVRNLGDADLVLGSITQEGAGAFALGSDPSGYTVLPGESQTLLVTFRPLHPDGDSGVLYIPSNDEDEPVVEVELVGNGGGDFAYPDAEIACPGTVDLAGPVVVHLDGTASTDPSALPLTYAWSVVRRPAAADPAGAPVPPDAPETDLRLDAAGTWEVQLVVTNSAGVSSVPEKCVIEAIPVDAVHVELSWSGATSDLDLHLADGDAAFYDVPGDVSWCNANPDWGAAGDTADDPRLDVDDDDGFGPENINIASPADGTYHVRVHLYDDGSDGLVTATVSVFTDGELVHTGQKILARNQVWDVGQVNWPDATFGVSNDPPWDAGGTRECP